MAIYDHIAGLQANLPGPTPGDFVEVNTLDTPKTSRRPRQRVFLIAVMMVLSCPARAADAGFTQFIASLWPEAQKEGVSLATFERETRNLEPDYKLPDLLLPGRPATGAPSQAELVQVTAD